MPDVFNEVPAEQRSWPDFRKGGWSSGRLPTTMPSASEPEFRAGPPCMESIWRLCLDTGSVISAQWTQGVCPI